jgi:serine/threonine protein kinase
MNPPSGQPPLPNGTLLQGYRLERPLGRGGFAFTYLAVNTTIGKRVAIKELFPESIVRRSGTKVLPVNNDAETLRLWQWALQKFKEEARILASFQHDNIVRVNTLLEANQTAYIVMDYVDGEPLDQFLKRSPRAPTEDQLRHIMQQVLDGLECIHRHGILHRDIKPSNIYLTSGGRVILLDFGAARPDNKAASSFTTIRPYTDGYSPFEQYQTNTPITAASDIYSAAATLVRAITGKAPPKAIDRSPTDAYVPIAQTHGRYYTKEFLRGIDAAMAFRPEHRPQSISQWRQLLVSKSGRTGQTSSPHKTAVSQTTSGAPTWAIIGLVFCVLACLTALGVVFWLDQPTSQEQAADPNSVAAIMERSRAAKDEWLRRQQSADPANQPPEPNQEPDPNPVPNPPSPNTVIPAASNPLLEALTVFAEQELEVDHGTNPDKYAATVTINNSGKPGDNQTLSRAALVQSEKADNEKFRTSLFVSLACNLMNYNKKEDEAEIQQIFTYERTHKTGTWYLGMQIRILTIHAASTAQRNISHRIVTAKAPGYRCRFSKEDHTDERGNPIVDSNNTHANVIKGIVHRDRVLYETRRHRDPEDTSFSMYESATTRDGILKISPEHVILIPVSAATITTIQGATPVVDVFPEVDNSALVILLHK